MLQYKIITDVTTEPVTAAEARVHLRVLDTADDTYITSLIASARSYAESAHACAYADKTIEAVTDTLGNIDLPIKTLKTLTSVVLTDSDGVEHNITADFIADYYSSRLIYTGSTNAYKLYKVNPIKVTYVATGTPDKTTRQAILLLVGHWYENRGDESNADIPEAAKRLLGLSFNGAN